MSATLSARMLGPRATAFPISGARFNNFRGRRTIKFGTSQSSRNFRTSHYLQDAQVVAPPLPPKRPLFRRTLNVFGLAIFFTTLGFYMSAAPAIKAANAFLNPPTDEDTLTMFVPQDDITKEVEEFIQKHPLALEMRSKSEYSESRPHLKIPEAQRSHSLTGGTLMGLGKVVVPPFVWCEQGGKSLVSISYVGSDLCGHPGLVHGGFLATMLDEGMARCCFAALPNKVAMTANLNINYRAPAPAGGFVVLRAKTTRVEGRKAWVEGHIETLVAEGEKPTILVEATALFIEPRQAATMAKVYPVS